MKGALYFAWLLFTARSSQRWLGGIGLVLLLLEFGLPRGTGAIAAASFILFVPSFTSGMAMRWVSAGRSLSLVPRGREQILLGALTSTLLIAGLMTLGAWLLRLPEFPDLMRISLGELFWRIEAPATVILLGGFVLSRSPNGMALALVLGSAAVAALIKHDPWPSISPMQLCGFTVLAWVAFGFGYLRVPHIAQPFSSTRSQESVSDGSRLAPAATAQLLEQPRDTARLWGSFVGAAMIVGFVLLISFLDVGGKTWQPQRYAGLFALVYATALGLGNQPLAARARRLWLHAGLDRQALFRTCEALAWRGMAFGFIPVIALLAFSWQVISLDPGLNLKWLSLHFLLAPISLYFALALTRGWRWPPALCGMAFLLTWMMLIPVARRESVGFLGIAMTAIAIAFVLRFVARRRWLAIDWVVCRPSRVARDTGRSLEQAMWGG